MYGVSMMPSKSEMELWYSCFFIFLFVNKRVGFLKERFHRVLSVPVSLHTALRGNTRGNVTTR